MKAVTKKLFCLMLAVMLLVSAIPFQAMAAGEAKVNMVVNFGTYKHTETLTVTTAEACAYQLVSMIDPEWADYYTFDNYNAGNGVKTNGSEKFAVVDGMTVTINMTEKDAPSAPSDPSDPGLITPIGPSQPTEPSEPAEPTTPPTEGEDDDGYGEGNFGEGQPIGNAGTCKLTINRNLEGTNVVSLTVARGTTYSSHGVNEMARGGYDFLGWYSSYYGRFIDPLKDVVLGDDVVEAMWSAAKKFTLTLDENRDDVETINRVLQVSYGEKIYDRVMAVKPADRDGYVFMGWKLNGKMITANTVYDYPDDATAYAVWALESDVEGKPSVGGTAANKGDVYLEIYINGDTAELVKRVKINDLAEDNKVTRAEVEKVAKKHVTAKSGYTLKYEGLFDEEGWWWYTRDPETNGKDTIVVNREGDEYIYVMVNNVKKVVADSTNPQTGDTITVAATTMVLAAAALVAMTELKKRKMI